jgi:hypothetical protein
LRRTKSTSSEAPLDRPVDDFVDAGIFSALLACQSVALGAESVNFCLHPAKQFFGGSGGDPGPLKILYLFALPLDLAAHLIDFSPDNA